MIYNKIYAIILMKGSEDMFVYQNQEQIIIEIKKIMLEQHTTQREIAEKLNITPQGFTKLLNKKNFSFTDAKKILDILGYKLVIELKENQSAL